MSTRIKKSRANFHLFCLRFAPCCDIMKGINEGEKSMQNFIAELDEYFCETYANYDKLCVLPGYKMPMMQASTVDEFGRTRAYTLPANTMRLALQEKKEELLADLKPRLVDTTFSFSFRPLGLFTALVNRFSKQGFPKYLKQLLQKYGLNEQTALEELNVDEEIWKKICKGQFMPTKNLIFSLALTAQLSFDDTEEMLVFCGEDFDYTYPKDVVISYLLSTKTYAPAMVERALAEYHVSNLFIK